MRVRVEEQEGRGESVGRGEGGHLGTGVTIRAGEIECAILERFWKAGNKAGGGKRC